MWDAFFHRGDIFGIILMDRTGKYDAVDIISNIRGTLSIKYSNPLSFQSLGKGAFGTVGAGDTKTGIRKDLCETTHTDTANTDKMYMNRFFKI